MKKNVSNNFFIAFALTLIVLCVIYFIYQNNKIRFYYEYIYHNFPLIQKIDLNIDSFFDEFNLYKKIFDSRDEYKRIDIKMSADDLNNFHKEKEKFLKLGYQKGELKEWRKIKLIIDGKQYKGKIKLHGNSATPLLKKFSFQFKLDNDGTFLDGKKRFKLIYGKTEIPLSVIVPNYIAKKEKLIAPIGDYRNLYINGVFYGTFYLSDMIAKEVLETEYGITDYAIFTANDDWDRMAYGHSSYLDIESENMQISGVYSNEGHLRSRIDEFFTKIKNKTVFNDNTLIDKVYLAKFLALQALTSESHNAAGDNLRLLLNARDGKIYPVFRNEGTSSERLIKIPRNPNKSIEKFNLMWLESYYRDLKEHLYINNAPAMELYRLFIQDGKLRSLRDKYINLFIKNKIYEQELKKTYENNKKVLLSGDIPKRYINYDIWASQNYNEQITKYAKNYIDYTKLFISYDPHSHKMQVLSDSFQPIKIETIKYTNQKGEEKEISIDLVIDSPNLNDQMEIIIRKIQAHINNDINEIKKIVARNLTTTKIIDDEDIYINQTDFNYVKNRNFIEILKNSGINYVEKNLTKNKKLIQIKKGKYFLKDNLIFNDNIDVDFEDGVEITMNSKVSILIYGNVNFNGNRNSPVVFKEKNENDSFGSIIIMGIAKNHKTHINHLIVTGGNDTYLNGIHSSAALMISHSDVTIDNLRVSKSKADDGLNVRFSKILISNSIFSHNFYDQVDLDFCEGIVKDNVFSGESNENGDGLDLSGSKVKITSNNFDSFVDKALSIGEKSEACIQENLINNSHIGIASKDDSKVFSTNNTFKNVDNVFETYLKKKMYRYPGTIIDESCSF